MNDRTVGFRSRSRLAGVLLTVSATVAAAQTQPQPPLVPSRPRAEVYRELLERQATTETALAQAQQRAADLASAIDQRIVSNDPIGEVIDAASLAALRARVEEQQRGVARLALRLEVDPLSLPARTAAAHLQLTRQREEIARLREELATPPASSGLQPSVALAGLRSHTFMLLGDRIAPFDAQHFSRRPINVRLPDRTIVQRTQFTRTSDAGTIADAVADGGVFHTLVTAPEFDRDRVYVTLWVCADAIAGFRTVSAFLGEQGVRYTWTADVDQPWVAAPGDPALEVWGYDTP